MRAKRTWRIVCTILFGIYMVVLCYLLLFSTRYRIYIENNYNLIPIQNIQRYINAAPRLFLRNILGNVVAFIPFGFCLKVITAEKIRLPIAVAACLGITLTFETLQMLFKVGIFDVDDILLNFIGGMIGLGVWYLLHWVIRKLCRERNGFAERIQEGNPDGTL